ncbi:RNA polymerase sigma-70 factor [Sphingobacterium sp. SYP-B4668]|uniref:RNA polymerase sigma-70 factor n=1 Tax=Sphingobacterium sp. SYP-B4668 TaxID=2996035 RepID=UPI0022DE535C|nr:RNA polymerase sigma-70 factor [Sphingobacterium sp. SYP-B4668]
MSIFQESTDEELVSLLKEGNEHAFSMIYQRHWRRLFVIASQKINSFEEAEEIVQDIFFSLWTRRMNLEIQGNLSNYLSVSVKYRVIRVLDKHYRHRNYLNSLVDMSLVDDSTQENLLFEELRGQLSKYVAELPEKCRLVFQLSREQGYSQKDIAKELNISEKTVETHLGKARKYLRSRLAHFFQILL